VQPAIFFDCDGVLNEEPGGHGVLGPDDVRLVPGAGQAVRAAREAGYLAIIVTNRAQVAKGLVTLAGLDLIFDRIRQLLARDGGIIDRIYFCPHHPERGTPGGVPEYQIACACRKPGTLLLRRAIADFGIDIGRSALIGDSLRDIDAGRAMGLKTYGVRTGYACRDVERYPQQEPPQPDLMFADVADAVDFCVSHRETAEPAPGRPTGEPD
jgi:D-glycero-D-manno-heptose 1,7-bisphosphate phosphatase